jgi:hypothetical protein
MINTHRQKHNRDSRSPFCFWCDGNKSRKKREKKKEKIKRKEDGLWGGLVRIARPSVGILKSYNEPRLARCAGMGGVAAVEKR